MKEKIIFNPKFSVANSFQGVFDEQSFKNEKSVYACTPDFIRKNCGDVTRTVLDNIPKWYFEEADKLKLSLNIDVRVHYLEKGDFPAYPGWHCDNALRELYFGQKGAERISVLQSLVCSVSSNPDGVSNTQFLKKPFTAIIEPKENDFEVWPQVNQQIGEPNKNDLFDTNDGQMISFDTQTLHRAMPAKNSGYRLFTRVSMWDVKGEKDRGSIAKFEQVYKVLKDKSDIIDYFE